MSDSLLSRGGKLLENRKLTKKIKSVTKKNKIIIFSIIFIFFSLVFRMGNNQLGSYAHAYAIGNNAFENKIESPIFGEKTELFKESGNNNKLSKKERKKGNSSDHMSLLNKIYEVVDEYPIKEMAPFISKRNEKVAAFLVGIAKKESGFGEHSPSRNGQDCYNYWGYKGSAGNGSVGGYACFESAEEAVEIVGNRIEVLVNRNHNTPESMVNTWKCGTSCKGDPGAPSWVSTVALYFDKIVS